MVSVEASSCVTTYETHRDRNGKSRARVGAWDSLNWLIGCPSLKAMTVGNDRICSRAFPQDEGEV
jgi:hypothetical protein